jgi:hypothetical protein
MKIDLEKFSLTAEEQCALLAILQRTRDARVRRRILGVLSLAENKRLAQAAAEAGLSPGTLHMWAVRYSKKRAPEALRPTTTRRFSRRSVAEISRYVHRLLTSPAAADWTLQGLRAHLWEVHRISVPVPTLERIFVRSALERMTDGPESLNG